MAKIAKQVTVFDSETGEIIKETVTFGSRQNGDDWVIWYRSALNDLAVNAPLVAWKVLAALASKQEFENAINTTKQAIADNLKISYDNVMRGFKWLKENNYVKERKVNGQTQFLLNPHVTTCGKNRKAKIKLWEETP